MIRRWLLVRHPDLWATGLPGMVASGLLLALLAAGYAQAAPLDLRALPEPGPLFGWSAVLSALLTLYWATVAVQRGDGGRWRSGAAGWTGLWATFLGLAVLNAAPFVAPEVHEARLRALAPRDRLERSARTFVEVVSSRALLVANLLFRQPADVEKKIARALGSKEAPDEEGARRLLALWARVPRQERTLPRALRTSGEALDLTSMPDFERVLAEFGPGLEAEFAADRPEASMRSGSDLLAEDNLRRAADAYDEDGEASHLGEVPETRTAYLTILLWLTLALALARAFSAVLVAGAAGGLAVAWIGLKLAVPLATGESGEEWWTALLWLGLWALLAALWGPVALGGRRTPRAVALLAAWMLLLPFGGRWLLALFEHDEEIRTPLIYAGLLATLALAPLLQLLLNRFRGTPEGESAARAGGTPRASALQRWTATHAPAMREDRLWGILGAGAGLTAVCSAYAASLPVSLQAPPSYDATSALPWFVGLLLTLAFVVLLTLDAPALPVRRGAQGWQRLPLLAVAFALLTVAPFAASEVVDLRLRRLVPAGQVRADQEHLEVLRKEGRPKALGVLKESTGSAPSRVKELAEALDYQVKPEHQARAEGMLRDWEAVPPDERTWVRAAEVMARHESWPGSEVPWQAVLARYGGDVEVALATAAGSGQTWYGSGLAMSSAWRLGGAHGLAGAPRPPWRDEDALTPWLLVAMVATLWVAGVRAVGVRWMVTGGVLLLVLFVALAILFAFWGLEWGDLNDEDLALMLLLTGCAVSLGLSVSILRRGARTWRLCLLLAVGLLGTPFLPVLVGMSYDLEVGSSLPFRFLLAGNALVLLAAPALQALLNLYRAAPGDS